MMRGMSLATLDQPATHATAEARPAAPSIARRFSFLDFQEDTARIATHLASGFTLGSADITGEHHMCDGDYVTLPLFVDWQKSLACTGPFWAVYPRTVTFQNRVYRFVGTHVGDRTVLYRALAGPGR